MSVAALLAELRHRDIRVWADGEQLRCSAPAGALVPKLREQLRQYKDDVLEFLHAAEALARQQPAIVPLQPHGARPAVFAAPGHNGDVFCYRALVQHLGDDQPFFGLQPPGLDGQSEPLASVEDLAAYFAAQIRAFCPEGPYVIAGYCAGGTIAFELARQLSRQGATIPFVALFGSPYPTWYRRLPQLREKVAHLKKHAQALISLSWKERRAYVSAKRQQHRQRSEAARLAAADPVLLRRTTVERTTLSAVRRYTPQTFAGRAVLFLPNEEWRRADSGTLRWPDAAAQRMEKYCGPDSCDGFNMLLEPYAAAFAELFRNAEAGTKRYAPGRQSKADPSLGTVRQVENDGEHILGI
ncbi:Thioesterase [Georgfuchsia toluolica]|uniref:Thioesterase n=1 Tax=Georgfuchsia toluolica TaxID=424218 RepID=A0A916J2S1_9PROT|nr:thioesterase domain-containing protein [Georgfuchsia toluolica]CAG4882927.1 Thioesterase [Georgfuchsia toluolica]CAG4882929.1 Thioesterase [Georgfuchsia toluolica]